MVTGADGFLGNNIVRELLKRNARVTALIHPESNYYTLQDLNIERYFGDVLRFEDVYYLSKKADVIIHAAACNSVWPSKNKLVRDVNITGTKNIINACKLNHIKRLIYVSSASVFSPGTLESPAAETASFTKFNYGLDYIDSKLVAHKMVLEAAKSGVPAILVNPTYMIGPYDSKPGSGKLLVSLIEGKVPVMPEGGKNFVSVKDVATAICNSITLGKAGESYILGNQNLSYKEFFVIAARLFNLPLPVFRLPKGIMLLMGYLNGLISGIIRTQPVISKNIVQASFVNQYYTSQKAVKELKMPQSSIESAIMEAVSWFQENNYLIRKIVA